LRDQFHPSAFDSRETRIRVRTRLSRFDQAEILYSTSFTEFTPRPRLVINPETGSATDQKVGNAGSPSHAFGVTLTHNFSDDLKLTASSTLINGFLWNFEDTESEAWKLLKQYLENSPMSCMADSPDEARKKLLCEVIDKMDGEIQEDWGGEILTKEAAKMYVMNYKYYRIYNE